MNYIEVPSGEDAAKRIVASHNKGESIPLFDVLIFLAWLTTLFVSVANNLKLKKLPVENVLAYIKPEDIEQRRIIENILSELRGCVGCHRVVVGMFHNGIIIGGTKHFDKLSIVYESVSPGVASIKEVIKNIPVTKLHSEIEKGLTAGGFCYYSKPNLEQECISHLDALGVESLISRLLINKHGVFGIVHFHSLAPVEGNPLTEKAEQLEKIFHSLETKLHYVIDNRKIPKKFLGS